VLQREFDVPRDQRSQCRPVVRGGGGAAPAFGQQPLADAHQHLGEHGVLAGEVPVERGPADAARRTELADRHPVIAALGEQSRRGGDDLVAARAGRHTPSLDRSG
jgi:hypothetical protein